LLLLLLLLLLLRACPAHIYHAPVSETHGARADLQCKTSPELHQNHGRFPGRHVD